MAYFQRNRKKEIYRGKYGLWILTKGFYQADANKRNLDEFQTQCSRNGGMETESAFEYLDDRVMRCSTDERRMITRLMKLAEQHPDEVEIIASPEDNDGCLYMKCPADWLLIRYPKKMNLTDEQKAAAAERMRKWRENRNADESNKEPEDEE